MRLVSDDALAVATVWAEARGESPNGRIAVAEVIRNRVAERYNAKAHTVAAVVFAPLQFSCWNAMDKNRVAAIALDDADPIVAACRDAWETACAGSDITHGALLYYAHGSITAPAWVARSIEVAHIGRHAFYRPRA